LNSGKFDSHVGSLRLQLEKVAQHFDRFLRMLALREAAVIPPQGLGAAA
jgi:hypothetical protein